MRGDPATFLNSGMFKGPSELRRSEGVLGAAPSLSTTRNVIAV